MIYMHAPIHLYFVIWKSVEVLGSFLFSYKACQLFAHE